MSIPSNAKKVFQGVLVDVFQWPQKLYDNSITTFEAVVRKPSVDVLAEVSGKLILVEQEQPVNGKFHGLPGGRLEDGEQPLEAAKRELLEETGYSSEDFELIEEFDSYGLLRFNEYLFVARNCKQTAKPHPDAGEKISLKLVNLDELLQINRKRDFRVPVPLRFMMYECLLDENKKNKLEKKIFR